MYDIHQQNHLIDTVKGGDSQDRIHSSAGQHGEASLDSIPISYLPGVRLNIVEMTLLQAIIQAAMSKPCVSVCKLTKTIGQGGCQPQLRRFCLPPLLLKTSKNAVYISTGSYHTEVNLDSAAIQDLM